MDRMTRSEADLQRRKRLEEEEEYEEYRRMRDRENAPRQERRTEKSRNERLYSEQRQQENRRPAEHRPAERRPGDRRYSRPPVRRKSHPILTGILTGLGIIVVLLVLAAAGLLTWINARLQRVDSPTLEKALQGSISDTARNNEVMADYTNIALFGVDSREQDLLEGDNRSDSIMIASIGRTSGEIRLISVFRDTYLEIGDGTYTKCNAAYAYGGPKQAVSMLDANLDMDITDFVTVGFEGLTDAIDALGGIELDLTEEEIGYMNSYMEDMYYELGIPYEEVEEPGLQKVSGIQATAYCRIRYTEGDDFKRAQRQRTVLSLTMDKIRAAGPLTLLRVADKVMGETATSLSSPEILWLMLRAGSFQIEEQGGFPEDSQWAYGTIDGQSVVVPTSLESNVRWLHGFLFGDEEFEPSEAVMERSEVIRNTPR